MAWPSGRVIPTAALSVRVQVLQGATVVNDVVLDKASPSTTFTEVPVGAVTVKATAYPASNGTGTAMATAQVAKTIAANATESVDLTMASTINRLTMTPNPVHLVLTLLVPVQLVVTAYDASNNVVLMSPSDLSYSTTNSALFNVSSTGVVTGLGSLAGSSTITATDAISGKSVTVPATLTLY